MKNSACKFPIDTGSNDQAYFSKVHKHPSMKQVWQAFDGKTFETRNQCSDYEKQAEWAWQFAEQSGLNTWIEIGDADYSKKVESGECKVNSVILRWLVDSKALMNFLYQNRLDIYKMVDVMKNVTQKVYGEQ